MHSDGTSLDSEFRLVCFNNEEKAEERHERMSRALPYELWVLVAEAASTARVSGSVTRNIIPSSPSRRRIDSSEEWPRLCSGGTSLSKATATQSVAGGGSAYKYGIELVQKLIVRQTIRSLDIHLDIAWELQPNSPAAHEESIVLAKDILPCWRKSAQSRREDNGPPSRWITGW
ncbi:hypothetical protein CF326_g2886 [Tilletia indica]|nr:hypothetical protein CF326_g2886 [Tilletia indica]